MSNLRTRLVKKAIAPVFANWHKGTVEHQRANHAKFSRYMVLPQGITCQPVQIGSINAEWAEWTSPETTGTILYLHGGAYVVGSITTHRMLAADLAKYSNARVLLIDYRLAPEDPFPAGLEDAITAYQWLLESGTPAEEILIAGDSAGGGLALAALLKLRDEGLPLPAGGILLSPWTDLTMSGDSIKSKTQKDFILDADHLSRMAKLYAGEADLRHPHISPLFADLRGLPPLLIQVGTDEILLDDSVRLAESAEKAGVDVQLEVYEEMFHVFHMFPLFREHKSAFREIGKFCRLLLPTD